MVGDPAGGRAAAFHLWMQGDHRRKGAAGRLLISDASRGGMREGFRRWGGWTAGGNDAAWRGESGGIRLNLEKFNQPLTIFLVAAMVLRFAVFLLCSYWRFRLLLVGNFGPPGPGRWWVVWWWFRGDLSTETIKGG